MPERFELGTLPYELLAGTTAAVDFLAGLGGTGGGPAASGWSPRWPRSRSTRTRCATGSRSGLRELPGVTAAVPRRAPHADPAASPSTAATPPTPTAFLAERGVNAPAGSFYAIEASRWLGLGDTGGLRVGLAPYSDASDVDRLLAGLRAWAAA